jgi:hypothetical protein
MTIEEEISKRKTEKQEKSSEFYVNDYELNRAEITFKTNNGKVVHDYRKIMKGDYEAENKIIDEKINELKSKIQLVWDDDINHFKLSRTYTDSGELKELIFDIPFEDNYEAFTVLEVYDEDGNFVADDVADELGDDMLKLKSENLYIYNLHNLRERKTIYTKESDYFKSVERYSEERKNAEEFIDVVSLSMTEWVFYYILLSFLIIPIRIDDVTTTKRELFLEMFHPFLLAYLKLHDLVKPLIDEKEVAEELY